MTDAEELLRSTAAQAGPMASLRRLAGTLVAIVQTRIELLSVAAKERALRLWRLQPLDVATLFFLGISLVFLSACVVVMAARWPRKGGQVVLGIYRALSRRSPAATYSHSIVPGGLPVMS